MAGKYVEFVQHANKMSLVWNYIELGDKDTALTSALIHFLQDGIYA